jgi:hypothetical protein
VVCIFAAFLDRNGPIGPLGTNSFRGGDALRCGTVAPYFGFSHVTMASISGYVDEKTCTTLEIIRGLI